MFYQSKRCRTEKSGWEKLSTFMMLIGGLVAAVYFGYRLMEKLRCKCKKQDLCTCGCEDEPVDHEYDHVSENDCLCHDKKDYYNRCGCFDTPDGNPPVSDDKESEETV